MSYLEMGMLLCFGVAWPIDIYKSAVTRTAKGKSLGYLLIVDIGYVAGIIHKALYSRDIVMTLYILNLLMVSADILLYLRNSRLDRKAALKGGVAS